MKNSSVLMGGANVDMSGGSMGMNMNLSAAGGLSAMLGLGVGGGSGSSIGGIGLGGLLNVQQLQNSGLNAQQIQQLQQIQATMMANNFTKVEESLDDGGADGEGMGDTLSILNSQNAKTESVGCAFDILRILFQRD